jgi:magnesium-transporting ATPase (P-type)
MGPLGLNLSWIQALLFAMGVMVCFVPEGLPATLSVALAVGVQRMAKMNATSSDSPA